MELNDNPEKVARTLGTPQKDIIDNTIFTATLDANDKTNCDKKCTENASLNKRVAHGTS